MPKKTKKQKIIADYRKKILNLRHQISPDFQLQSPNQPINIVPDITSSLKEEKQPIKKITHLHSFTINKEELENEKKIFIVDIKKSTIISLTIILFLFLIYWLGYYINYLSFFN